MFPTFCCGHALPIVNTINMQINRFAFKAILPSLLSILVLTATAQDKYEWPVRLEKDYTKTLSLNGETVFLSNRYGPMKIEHWDRNEVKVTAHVTASARDNEFAKKVLDRISVKDEKKTDVLSFETSLEPWSNDGSNGGYEMNIEYTVYVPASARLHAENSYGPLSIGNHSGTVELICRYGALTAGRLSGNPSIAVDYGKAKIAAMAGGKLIGKYSRIDIDMLSGEVSGELQYCSSFDLPVDNTLKRLELKTNYTNVYLAAPQDFSASYDITTTNARFTTKAALAVKEDNPENGSGRMNPYSNTHRYSGTVGKGGNTTITIKSNYGNVRMM